MDLPGAPLFRETDELVKTREIAVRLASSDLAIVISGEVGTGRRTLAGALASIRAARAGRVLTVSGFEELPVSLRDGRTMSTVVMHHLHALSVRGQSELAGLVRDRRVLLIATRDSGGPALASDLAALVDTTEIVLPPLRARSDAVAWAEMFVARAAAELVGRVIPLSSDARASVATQQWPGNLAELDSILRRAVVLARVDLITPADLGLGEGLVVRRLSEAVDEYRMSYVAKVLAHFDGNRSQAARALGIDARTIFRYLAKAKPEE